MTVMLPKTGRGWELQQMLRKELGIPEGVQWFEVRFATDEAVTVKCQYVPRAPEGPSDEEVDGA